MFFVIAIVTTYDSEVVDADGEPLADAVASVRHGAEELMPRAAAAAAAALEAASDAAEDDEENARVWRTCGTASRLFDVPGRAPDAVRPRAARRTAGYSSWFRDEPS